MSDTIQARKWFFIFCVFQLIAWTLEPYLARHNVPFDAIEGVAWGNMWFWGYEKHPPLAAWLSAGLTNLTGAIEWPIYLLGQLSVVTCFWAMWRIATKIVPPWQALIAVVVLSGIYYYNLASSQFNPNVLMLATWALTSLAFYNALQSQKVWHWCLVGICAGLAMMTKYEAALLFVAMLAVLIFTREGRKSFKHFGVYFALIIGFLIWLPNLIWLAQHNFNALFYAAERMDSKTLKHVPWFVNNLYQPIRFLTEQLGAAVPAFILMLPFLLPLKRQPTPLVVTDFNKRFVLLMGLGPLAVTLLISLASGMWLHSLWGFPFLSFVGLILVIWLKPTITAQRLKYFGILVAVLAFTLLIVRAVFLIYGPLWTQQTTANNFPGKPMAQTLAQLWHNRFHTPMPYIAGDHSVAINVSGYSPDHPVPYYFGEVDDTSPWVVPDEVRKSGGVFTMRISEPPAMNALVREMLSQYPEIKEQIILEFPLQGKTDKPPIRLWVGFLPPAKL